MKPSAGICFWLLEHIWCKTGKVNFCRRQNHKSWSTEENAEPEAVKRPSTWQWKIRLVLFYLVWWGKNREEAGRCEIFAQYSNEIMKGSFFPLYGIFFPQWSAALAISHTSVKSRWTVSQGNTSTVFFHTRKPGHPGNLQLGRQMRNRK